MIVRTLVSLVNVAILVSALVLAQILVPHFATWVFYALLVWFGLSLVLFRLPSMNRGVGSAARSTPGPAPPAHPPSPLAGGESLGFCMYCATPIEPGTPVCPSCGHPLPLV